MEVRFERVSKSYGSVTALRQVTLTIGSGITGLLGPNGAGKTTLLNILATLLRPSDGDVSIDGLSPTNANHRAAIRRRLGYLPQDLGYYPQFRVAEFVDYVAALKGVGESRERGRQVRLALDAVSLSDVARRKIRTLSGGMRQRLGIAQALTGDPDLLLLDEPTSGLDPEQRIRFRELIASLGQGRTVILSTHLVEDVAAVCNRVAVLWQGRILFTGSPRELRNAAQGMVWICTRPVEGAIASWRTEEDRFRVVATHPNEDAVATPPTMEDGYLVLTADAPEAE